MKKGEQKKNMKKKNPEDKKIKVVICLTREEISLLDNIAKYNNRSRSGMIAAWIREEYSIIERTKK